MLAIAHGSTITTWQQQQQQEQQRNGASNATAIVNTLVIPQYHGGNHQQQQDDDDASIITDLCWNHNGQALAACADTTQQQQPSIVLINTTAAVGGGSSRSITGAGMTSTTIMDAFPHDTTTATTRTNTSSNSATIPTSIAFGGTQSRYLCISNDVGHVGLWDLKHKSRVRSYNTSTTSTNAAPSLQTAMDGTFCYSLTTDALHIFHIKQGTMATSIRAMVLVTGNNIASSNRFTRMQLLGMPAEESKHANDSRTATIAMVAIGTRNGDIEIHRIVRSSNTGNGASSSLLVTKMKNMPHQAAIQGMDVLSNNSNGVILVSCSADGILCFIHVEQQTTIQSIQCSTTTTTTTDSSTSNTNIPMNLTSLSVEGNRCAVGTDTGTVHIYNVRHLDSPPLAILELGNAITTLKFAPTSSRSNCSKAVATATPLFKPSVLSTPPRPTTAKSLFRSSRSIGAPVSPLRQSVDELSDMVQDVLMASPKKRRSGLLQHPPSIPKGDNDEQEGVSIALLEQATTDLTTAMNVLRDDVNTSIRNVHVDMIRQFQAQNDHLTAQLTEQSTLFETIMAENQVLRRENERLVKQQAANDNDNGTGTRNGGKKLEA